MIAGKQNQSKTTGDNTFSLEDGTSLLLESLEIFTLEASGTGLSALGQRKSGIYLWGDSVATWGDATGLWGGGTVFGVNQTRTNLTGKANQIKN